MTLVMTLASCGGKKAADTASTTVDVQGARFALTFGDIVRGRRILSNRPSAPLAIFTAVYLSGGGFLGSASAIQGVLAQAQFHAKPGTDQLQNTFDLLTEFGTVLSVDIADVLNRSQDRSTTMNEYIAGLQNITERCTQKLAELEQELTDLQTQQRTARQTAGDLDREVKKALQDEDYAAAGEKQPDLAAAQSKVAEIDSNVKQEQAIIQAYKSLLAVSDKRTKAITENREILIAGLKVIDVPGADALGILEQQNLRSRIGL